MGSRRRRHCRSGRDASSEASSSAAPSAWTSNRPRPRCAPRFWPLGERSLPNSCDTLFSPRSPSSSASAAIAQPAPNTFDVVVYGGTAGGVVTAIAAAREGASVALLEPRDHLGGMVSGGLGWTDFGKKEVIGGYALEFYERAGKKYGVPIQWYLEPHVAEAHLPRVDRRGGRARVLPASTGREDGRDHGRHARSGHPHGERRDVPRQGLCRRDLRGRPHGPGRRVLHVRARGDRQVRRVAGRRARSDAAAPVPGQRPGARRVRRLAAGDLGAAARARGHGRHQAAGLQLPRLHDAARRQPRAVPDAERLHSGPIRVAGEDARGHGRDQEGRRPPIRPARNAVATRRTGSPSRGRCGT